MWPTVCKSGPIMDLDEGLRAYLVRSGVLLKQLSCPCTDEHLAAIAEAIDDWELLTPHLGVLKPKETAIKRDNPGYVKQKQELLREWKVQGGIEATYLNLCKVFWRQQKKNLVSKVCGCVRATLPQLPVSSSDSLVGIRERPLASDPEAVSTVALRRASDDTCTALQERPSYYGPLKVPRIPSYHPPQDRIKQVEKEISKLEGQFSELVVKTKSVVKQSMAKDPATFREDFICGLLSIDDSKKPLHRTFLESKIQEAESVELIIRALSFYWNFINSDLLEHIIASNFADNADLQNGLKSYRATKCSFCETTTVCEFEAAKAKLPLVLPKFEIPSDFCVVVVQVVKKWADYTLAEALATWQSIAEDIQVRKILGFYAGGSSSNSVNLIWAVAPDVVSVVAEVLGNRQVRERNAIQAVCVDGKLLAVRKTEQEVRVSTMYIVILCC